MNMKKTITSAFEQFYGSHDGAVFTFAPGRVNLIGEHIDYNGGHVLPCALTMGVYALGKLRADERLRMYSLNCADDGVVEIKLGDLAARDGGWTDYVKGVIWSFSQDGLNVRCGMDLVIGSDLPAGAGLSSSAALEMAVGALLCALFGWNVGGVRLAQIARRAENDYVGMNCGIMDQFASGMGRKDHAIDLDTETLEYRTVPLALNDQTIVITNTNKKHQLAGSAYNDRRRECEQALEILRAAAQARNVHAADAGSAPTAADTSACIKELCDLTPAQFDLLAPALCGEKNGSGSALYRRAHHAVYENARTIEAAEALEAGDLKRFGSLMNESHVSLRDDFEVTCPELDLLAETAWEIEGVYGSRMTGGGFGGCTVSIVENAALGTFQQKIAEAYRSAFGYDCTFYLATAGDGAHVIDQCN